MIKTKLLLIEYATINDHISKDHKKLQAIRSVRDMLLQIDFNAEIVPTESYSKLKELLESLKGSLLTENEEQLVGELIKEV